MEFRLTTVQGEIFGRIWSENGLKSTNPNRYIHSVKYNGRCVIFKSSVADYMALASKCGSPTTGPLWAEVIKLEAESDRKFELVMQEIEEANFFEAPCIDEARLDAQYEADKAEEWAELAVLAQEIADNSEEWAELMDLTQEVAEADAEAQARAADYDQWVEAVGVGFDADVEEALSPMAKAFAALLEETPPQPKRSSRQKAKV